MRKIKFASILVILLVSLLSADDLNIINQNQDYLTLRFELAEYQIEDVETEHGIFQKITYPQAILHCNEGRPLLPYRSEIVGLPVEGDVEFELINKTQITASDMNIYPAKRAVNENNEQATYFYQDQDFYSKDEMYPRHLLSKGKSACLGDRNFIGIMINPFQYNPVTEELLITNEVTFRIRITGDKSETRSWAGSSNFIDKVGDSFCLNNKYARKWRKPENTVDFAPPNREDAVDEIQIIVDEEGIYRVSYEMIINSLTDFSEENEIEFEMAFDWNSIDPRYLELSSEFGTVPIHFVGENDGSFDQDDYFEFYGDMHYGDEGYYDDFTFRNVYKLHLEDHFGSRMAVENGGLEVTDEHQFYVPESFQQTIHFEEQNVYNPLGNQFDYMNHYNITNYYREDIYFWDRIDAPNLEIYPFEIQYPDQSYIKTFNAKISLFGSTYSDDDQLVEMNHHTIVRINSSLINDHIWSGQTEKIFENETSITNDVLNHNTNYLYISLPGIQGISSEQALLDYLELKYWREYRTDEDYIKFTWPQNRSFGLFQFEIHNFSTGDISVYKINSSIMENVQIESFYEYGGAPYKITFQDSVLSDNVEYYAVSEEQKKQPLSIRPNLHPILSSNTNSLLATANSAEYLIIAASEFVNDEGTSLYREIWENQGKAVEVIDVQDIYDEFNFGIESAFAIKEFLTYVYNNWSSPQLTHVMFLGDGINDIRDDSPENQYNFIPIKKEWVKDLGAIASENWYSCIVGDDLISDIIVGRVNIWKKEQILDMANKTQHYIQNPNFNDMWHNNVIIGAGGKSADETAFFAEQAERTIENWIPNNFNVKRLYLRVDDQPTEYLGNTPELKNYINEGSIFLQFSGHGAGNQWGNYNLMSVNDVPTLNNDNYLLLSSLSCYGNAFQTQQTSCIGEQFLLTPEKGSIGSFGFTGFGYENTDEFVANALADAIFCQRLSNIGEIMNYAKAKFYLQHENVWGTSFTVRALVGGFALLGDPMIDLILPDTENNIIINKPNASTGDILYFKADVGPDISSGKFVIYDELGIQLDLADYIPLEIAVMNDTLTNQYYNQFIVPESEEDIYTRTVKMFAYGDNKEISGQAKISVGQSAVNNVVIQPVEPSCQDSILISADFFDEDGIETIYCDLKLWIYTLLDPIFTNNNPADAFTIEMSNIEENNYSLTNYIPPQPAGYKLTYEFRIIDESGEETLTPREIIYIKAPDLMVFNIQLAEYENNPSVKVLIKNMGTADSKSCALRLYDNNTLDLLNEVMIDPLVPTESRWEYIPIPIQNGTIQYLAFVNQSEEYFQEMEYDNSFESEEYEINMFRAGLFETEASSIDDNLECVVPANLFDSHQIFFLNNLGYMQPQNQPSIAKVLQPNDSLSSAYEIGIIDETLLADTLGHFPNNDRVAMKFYYHATDSLTQIMENQGNMSVYRWENNYRKWIFAGGEIDMENNYVVFETDRTGCYALFQNNDDEAPQVSVNVEGQEFQHTEPQLGEGGYVSENGVISFLITDSDGIDVFDHDIDISLSDGLQVNEIEPEDYTIALSVGQLTSIPIKYQLDLDKGDYLITVECVDVNGKPNSKTISFEVNKGLDIINIGNYPNPVVSLTENPNNEGRTRFTYVLTDRLNIEEGDEFKLKIYTVSGRLVKTFDLRNYAGIGYHEFPRSIMGWDCRDEDGKFLANGVYFYRFIAKKGNKKIVKTNKMAILK